MEEINDITTAHADELEALKEENSILNLRLEDFENRARRSNLRILGIPEFRSHRSLHITRVGNMQVNIDVT